MIKKTLLFLVLAMAMNFLPGKAMNVVFFLVDDMGYHDLSLTGSEFYETPRIDSLAGDGLMLDQAYSAFPRCVPSRFAMMSGVHPSRAEGDGENTGRMKPERVTLAEALKAHGYATFFAGKWHIGKKKNEFPEAQGFDVNIAGGSAGAPGSYFPPYGSDKPGLTGPEVLNNDEGKYLTDVLTDKTLEFIDEHQEEPFFVYFSHYAVHTPIQGKQDKTERYSEKVETIQYEGPEYDMGKDGRHLRHQNNAGYAAMVESVDESLGRIVERLKELGIYDETIIILTSDHGGLSNAGINNKRELATTNLPLRAGKGHMYEGGIRVPVIVRWPGHAEEGKTASFPITGMDYYPTILQMLELPLQPDVHEDGVSFVPGIKGECGFNEDRSFFWYSDKGRLTSTGDRNAAVIRRGNYKLLEFFSEKEIELYDLSKDPAETENLAESLPAIRESLYKELLEWKSAMKVKDRNQTTKFDY
ncbi:sulfatase [Puniceicoccales bacterium CK1056]|uniref:Sulfatase n=1 Tax=Oceanipulchritudo coccoides TaxID=2706888 RepID=A0A6B2M369_9BACT|nr:sulfatase [Oceanipulchritudo coccoides]NDV63203.1 sulfatase [Oceanipulchritudo coccoides]